QRQSILAHVRVRVQRDLTAGCGQHGGGGRGYRHPETDAAHVDDGPIGAATNQHAAQRNDHFNASPHRRLVAAVCAHVRATASASAASSGLGTSSNPSNAVTM